LHTTLLKFHIYAVFFMKCHGIVKFRNFLCGRTVRRSSKRRRSDIRPLTATAISLKILGADLSG
jgi:hypothetical protein